jgi:hypothetical protein
LLTGFHGILYEDVIGEFILFSLNFVVILSNIAVVKNIADDSMLDSEVLHDNRAITGNNFMN